MIEVDMKGMVSGFCYTKTFNSEWYKRIEVVAGGGLLIILFVMKLQKWGVLKVENIQVAGLQKDGDEVGLNL